MKVVEEKDFIRSRASFGDHFIITGHGAPQGIYLSVDKIRMMSEEEISELLGWVIEKMVGTPPPKGAIDQ